VGPAWGTSSSASDQHCLSLLLLNICRTTGPAGAAPPTPQPAAVTMATAGQQWDTNSPGWRMRSAHSNRCSVLKHVHLHAVSIWYTWFQCIDAVATHPVRGAQALVCVLVELAASVIRAALKGTPAAAHHHNVCWDEHKANCSEVCPMLLHACWPCCTVARPAN
jgi:hypothetical protein